MWRVFSDLSKKGLNLRIIELIKRIFGINPRTQDQEVIEEKVLDKAVKVKKEAKKSNPKSKKTVKKKKKKSD